MCFKPKRPLSKNAPAVCWELCLCPLQYNRKAVVGIQMETGKGWSRTVSISLYISYTLFIVNAYLAYGASGFLVPHYNSIKINQITQTNSTD